MGIAQWFGAAAQKIENPIKEGSLKLLQVQKDSQSQLAKGPYAALEGSKFDTTDLRYPLDLATSIDKLHYIKFSINVQERSRYNVNERTDLGPTINQNRLNDSNTGIGTLASYDNIGKSLGVTGRLLADATAGAAVGASLGGFVGTIAGAARGPGVGIAAAAIAGGVGGVVGGAIVESIDISRKTKRIKSTISLYMPDGFNTDMTHNYSQVSMTEALGIVGAFGQGGSAIGTSVAEAAKNISGLGTYRPELKSAGSGAMSELTAQIAAGAKGALGEGIDKAIMFSAGLAVNPQIEFMYESTGHREFQFIFKFIPRNKTEADAVRKIVKQFRFHSSPELLPGSTGRYFIPPAEFDIQFFYGNAENTNIPKISTCVLTKVQLQTNSEGPHTTFQDGMPVEMLMTLNFQELELMYKQRIDEGY